MQAGLTRGPICPTQQAAAPQAKQITSRLSKSNADLAKALRVVPKAAQVEEVAANSSLSNGTSSTSNPLAFDELTEILRMVHDTDIVELELRSKRFSLAVRKKEALEADAAQAAQFMYPPAPPQAGPPQYAPQAAYAPPPMVPAPPAAPPAPMAGPSSNGQAAPAAAPPAAEGGVEVASPMAGMMYRSPAPGEPPFVKDGDKVTKGQTICIIEAMKLMNEIEADASGTLVQFLAPNGSSVTIGQPLALIKP